MSKHLLAFAILILSQFSFSVPMSRMHVSGVVQRFDEKNVVIVQHGRTLQIPIRYLKTTDLRAGQIALFELDQQGLESVKPLKR